VWSVRPAPSGSGKVKKQPPLIIVSVLSPGQDMFTVC